MRMTITEVNETGPGWKKEGDGREKTVDPAKRKADRLPPIRFDYLPWSNQGALGAYAGVTYINNNATDHNKSQ